jgi:5-methylcytosine-specific restriction endonuclease McrA
MRETGSWVKRRKRLNPVSPKRRAYKAELREVIPFLIARSNGVCELCLSSPAVHPHHRLRRSQGGTNDLENLLAVCSDCHALIHEQPTLSYRNGWLLRGKRLTDYMQTWSTMGTEKGDEHER